MSTVIPPPVSAPAGSPSADRVGSARGAWRMTVLTGTALLLAGCVAAVITTIVPSRAGVPGIVDASPFVELALPALKAVFDFSAAVTIGWLVAAVVLVPTNRSGGLNPGGFRAIRAASLAAVVWAASGLALIPVGVADLGPSLQSSLRWEYISSALQASDSLRGYGFSAIAALVIALNGRAVLRVRWAALLLLVALLGVLPLAITGHASVSGDHDVAVDTMVYHLVGISVWIGGLVAFLGLVRQRVDRIDVVAQRYSAIALVAFVAVAISGVVNAWIRLDSWSDLWSTPYGRLVAIKAIALITLGTIGVLHRRRTLPALSGGDRSALVRLAGGEILLMAVTVGVAAALARTAPPVTGILPSAFDANLIETLGFTLSGPPTPWRLLVDWRFDYLLGTATVLLAVLYVVGVRRLRQRGDSWPPGRLVAFLAGCAVVLVATSSGIGRYAQSQFSIHMVAHMLLGMTAPILLALGGPVTLALRALPARRDGVPGAREAVKALTHGPLLRFLTHPLIVFPLFIGSFYAIYFTPLFSVMISSHIGHLLMSVHFLLVGYLYYWTIIGVDPAPRRLSPFVKLAMLLAALPFHAFFGLTLLNSHELISGDYYSGLNLPWATNLLADQRLGGGIAWAVAEIPTLIVLLALMVQWSRADDRRTRHADRRRDVDDPELDAYNRMLAGLSERQPPVES